MVDELYVVEEISVFRVAVVLSENRGQRVDVVLQFAAASIVAYLLVYVIVERIGEQFSRRVLKAHLALRGSVGQFRQARVAVVIQLVGPDEESVALLHADMAECVERIYLWIVIG